MSEEHTEPDIASSRPVKFILPVILTLLVTTSATANLLQNNGFESGNLTGWVKQYTPTQSGSVVTGTAKRSGSYGCWMYTANGSAEESFSYVAQKVSANPNEIFTAEAYIATPPPGQWVDWISGSYACVRVQFLSVTDSILASFESSHLTTGNTPYAGVFSVTTPSTLAGTTHVEMQCFLYEPAGATGQSVVTFDDCSLSRQTVAIPQLEVDQNVLGFGSDLTEISVTISNSGTGTLTWNAVTGDPWINISPPGGSTTTNQVVRITVGRAELNSRYYSGGITVSSDGGSEDILVYMETPPPHAAPSACSLVSVDGRQLLVRRRLSNGHLDIPRPYVIKGAAWSPSSIGTTSAAYSRRNEFEPWHRLDIRLLKEMNANTVYTFLGFGTDPTMLSSALAVLDYCYWNGIMVIMTVDEDGTDNSDNISQVVNAYKDHPAILMWALGNEWNLWRPDRPNYYHNYTTIEDAALAIQSNALLIKSFDTNHPVCSILGEINYPSQYLMQTIVSNICTAVDVWGANIYRGPEFYALFEEWETMSTKPLFLSEFGTDAFATSSWWPAVGTTDEDAQALHLQSLWLDLSSELSADDPINKVCLGGTVFEWNDEWWKSSTGTSSVHDPDGYETDWNPIAHPDGFANEEWFGVVDIERTPRQAYFTLQSLFSPPSHPLVLKLYREGNVFTLDFPSTLGNTYRLWRSIDLIDWELTDQSIIATSPNASFPVDENISKRRFYRLK